MKWKEDGNGWWPLHCYITSYNHINKFMRLDLKQSVYEMHVRILALSQLSFLNSAMFCVWTCDNNYIVLMQMKGKPPPEELLSSQNSCLHPHTCILLHCGRFHRDHAINKISSFLILTAIPRSANSSCDFQDPLKLLHNWQEAVIYL